MYKTISETKTLQYYTAQNLCAWTFQHFINKCFLSDLTQGIGASSHARVGASLEGQPLCPGECKYDPDGKDLSYLVKKVRRKARRANLQDEAEVRFNRNN